MDPAAEIARLVKAAAEQPNASDGWAFTCGLVTAMNQAIVDVGGLRRQYGRRLQAEGWTEDEIATSGGVTRQRVDQILKQ